MGRARGISRLTTVEGLIVAEAGLVVCAKGGVLCFQIRSIMLLPSRNEMPSLAFRCVRKGFKYS